MQTSPRCNLCDLVLPGAPGQKKRLKGYQGMCEKLKTLGEHQTLDRVKGAWERSELYVHEECRMSLFNKSKAAVRSTAKKGKLLFAL